MVRQIQQRFKGYRSACTVQRTHACLTLLVSTSSTHSNRSCLKTGCHKHQHVHTKSQPHGFLLPFLLTLPSASICNTYKWQKIRRLQYSTARDAGTSQTESAATMLPQRKEWTTKINGVHINHAYIYSQPSHECVAINRQMVMAPTTVVNRALRRGASGARCMINVEPSRVFVWPQVALRIRLPAPGVVGPPAALVIRPA